MSQVMSLNYDLSGPFGDFGKSFNYDFNIVYMLENIFDVGINNTNVVVIPGDLDELSKQELSKYYIDTRKWKEDMLKFLHKPENFYKTIEYFYSQLPDEFKKQYENKFGSINEQIKKMKPL